MIDIRQQLTEALRDWFASEGYPSDFVRFEPYAAALLPVVEAYGREQAAAALNDAADEIGVPTYWRRRLDARAAALTNPTKEQQP